MSYYKDSSQLACKPCNRMCRTCNGPAETECTSCFSENSYGVSFLLKANISSTVGACGDEADCIKQLKVIDKNAGLNNWYCAPCLYNAKYLSGKCVSHDTLPNANIEGGQNSNLNGTGGGSNTNKLGTIRLNYFALCYVFALLLLLILGNWSTLIIIIWRIYYYIN